MGNSPEDEDELTKAATCFGLDISESLQQQTQVEELCEVWPQNWDALRLFLVCQSQWEVSLGGMGGVIYMPARSVNVQQELTWLNLTKEMHASTVTLFRRIETEALRILNARTD